MTKTQKILFQQVILKMNGIEEKVQIVIDKAKHPEVKREDWIAKANETIEDLRQCVFIFQTICDEVNGKI